MAKSSFKLIFIIVTHYSLGLELLSGEKQHSLNYSQNFSDQLGQC